MDIAFEAWLFAVAIAASALGGALGMASGIFIVPILTVFGGVSIHTAVAASIVSVIACSCGGAPPFLRDGSTNLRLAVVLETATTLGAVSGVLLAGMVSTAFLYLLFAGILLISAWQMMRNRREQRDAAIGGDRDLASALRLHSSYPDGGRETFYRVGNLPLGLALMYGAGVVSAMLGIGSGVLKIPAMDTALRLPIKVSSATSNFMIGVTACASGLAYFARGQIVPAIAGPVALGSVLGAMAGGRLLRVIPAGPLRVLFVIVLIALAGLMLLSAAGFTAGHAR